jgi:hypothetical protein
MHRQYQDRCSIYNNTNESKIKEMFLLLFRNGVVSVSEWSNMQAKAAPRSKNAYIMQELLYSEAAKAKWK